MKTLGILILTLIVSLVLPGVVAAQSYQGPTGTISALSVNKTVQRPGMSTYVDNLGVTDSKYQPGNIVRFQVTVKNTGSTTLSNITLTDNLPKFMVNPADNKSQIIAKITSLTPGQSTTVSLNGQIASASALPNDQRIFCLSNQAVVTVNTHTSTDNAQFCVENPTVTEVIPGEAVTKGGQPVYTPQNVTTAPKTGPEALALMGLLPAGALGYFLRKNSK